MERILLWTALLLGISACGIIQFKSSIPENNVLETTDAQSSQSAQEQPGHDEIQSVQAPLDASREIRKNWNGAERGRIELLHKKYEPAQTGTCMRYAAVEKIDPNFSVSTASTGRITVRERVNEVCGFTLKAINDCRTKRSDDSCPGLKPTVDVLAALLRKEPHAHQLPTWVPLPLKTELDWWLSGVTLSLQMTGVYEQFRSKAIEACVAIQSANQIAANFPASFRTVYQQSLSSSKDAGLYLSGPKEGWPMRQRSQQAKIRPDRNHIAYRDPWQTKAEPDYYGVVASRLNTSIESISNLLNAMDEWYRIHDRAYSRANDVLVGNIQQTDESRLMTSSELRKLASDTLCARDYRPFGTLKEGVALTAAEVAGELEKAADKLDERLKRLAEEQAEAERCQADPVCKKEQELLSIEGELCASLNAAAETHERMKQRLKEARKYGVINKKDQYDDMEDKQFYDDRIKELKQRFKEVGGKAFNKNVCRDYDY